MLDERVMECGGLVRGLVQFGIIDNTSWLIRFLWDYQHSGTNFDKSSLGYWF